MFSSSAMQIVVTVVLIMTLTKS